VIKILSAVICFFCASAAIGQRANWQNLDLHQDSVFGISTEKAYRELMAAKDLKPANRVLVAVIDGGVDTGHEDLVNVIWKNPGEIAGNRKDDDRNGYTDDVHGWNFIGSARGNVQFDNLELVRLVRKEKPIYDHPGADTVSPSYREGLSAYRKMLQEYTTQLTAAQDVLEGAENFRKILLYITREMGNEHPTIDDFRKFQAQDEGEEYVRKAVIGALEEQPGFDQFKASKIDAEIKHYQERVNYYLNVDFDPRPIVGDDYNNDKERFYGNPDVTGPSAEHGTHVAGIIGAQRDNHIGIQGVADHVWIMGIRVVPSGDERDKDVANAIRYAADMGAKVVNMSFGKGYSWDKKAVDEAVQYAISKDVLLIHAAGNEGKNLDSGSNFPNRRFADGSGYASAWIEVGASGPQDDSSLVPLFSNYGKSGVDVFAPGVNIYSAAPGSAYATYSGTSMAAPVVTGLAALIRSYYPRLTAVEVKDIILRSVVKVNHSVIVKDMAGDAITVPFASICVSGGIVNAYQALQLAAVYK
jgi:subtilisin family serine protease